MSAKKREWLESKKKVAERCFKKYDGGKGYIDKHEVGLLISDTYAQVGITKTPT
jgi:hypothetical protein